MNLSVDQAARLLALAERLKQQARRAFMDAERCPLNAPAPPDWQRRALEMAAMVDANAAWAIEAILGASAPRPYCRNHLTVHQAFTKVATPWT